MVVHRCRCLNVSIHVGDDVRPMTGQQGSESASKSSLSSSISSNVSDFVVAEDLKSKGIMKNVSRASLGFGGLKKEYEELSSVHQLPNGMKVYRCDNCLTNFMATSPALPTDVIMLNADLIVGSEAHEARLSHERYSKTFRIIIDESDAIAEAETNLRIPKGIDQLEKKLQVHIAENEAMEKRFMQDRVDAYTHNQQIYFKKFQIGTANQKQMLIERMSDKNRKQITISGSHKQTLSLSILPPEAESTPSTPSAVPPTTGQTLSLPLTPSIGATKKLTLIDSASKPSQLKAEEKATKKVSTQPKAPSASSRAATASGTKSIRKESTSEKQTSSSVFSFEEEQILEEEMRSRGQISKYEEYDDEEGEEETAEKSGHAIKGAKPTTVQSSAHYSKSLGSSTSTPLGTSVPISIPPTGKAWDREGIEEDEEEEDEEGEERLMPHQIAASMFEYSSSFDSSRRNTTNI